MTDYSSSTPGVYVKEIAVFPPSVAEVETAIPAFIGYTEIGYDTAPKAVRISSLLEYEQLFGYAPKVTGTIHVDKILSTGVSAVSVDSGGFSTTKFVMYYAMQMYFANGGGPCYIVSLGNYQSSTPTPTLAAYNGTGGGLEAISREDEPTILVFPDAKFTLTTDANYYTLMQSALAQCSQLQDRVTIIDVDNAAAHETVNVTDVGALRNLVGNNIENLKYGAAYIPFLKTILNYQYDESDVTVKYRTRPTPTTGSYTYPTVAYGSTGTYPKLSDILAGTPTNFPNQFEVYNLVKAQADSSIAAINPVILPPSSSIAGVYASVDSSRGVWKAPANVSLSYVVGPKSDINDGDQSSLNIDVTGGKSINAIRAFTGKGTLVWGARTLAGNDNEWKYVSVRRFFNFAEESVKKSTGWVVFEPNDPNTWVKVKSMIDGFLTKQWRAGALAGAKPEQAFFVKVGLGQTMTQLDVLEGRLNIEIGMAVVRPGEFIILKFSHKMQEA